MTEVFRGAPVPTNEDKRLDPLAGVVETVGQQVQGNPGLAGLVAALQELSREMANTSQGGRPDRTPSDELLAAVSRWQEAAADPNHPVVAAAAAAVEVVLEQQCDLVVRPLGSTPNQPQLRALPNLVIPPGESGNGVFGNTPAAERVVRSMLPELPPSSLGELANVPGAKVKNEMLPPVSRVGYAEEGDSTRTVWDLDVSLRGDGRGRTVQLPDGGPKFKGRGVTVQASGSRIVTTSSREFEGDAMQLGQGVAMVPGQGGQKLTIEEPRGARVRVTGRRNVTKREGEGSLIVQVNHSRGGLVGPGIEVRGKGSELRETWEHSQIQEGGLVQVVRNIFHGLSAVVAGEEAGAWVGGSREQSRQRVGEIGWESHEVVSSFAGKYEAGPGKGAKIKRDLPGGGGVRLGPGDTAAVDYRRVELSWWELGGEGSGGINGHGQFALGQGTARGARTRAGGPPLRLPGVELEVPGSGGVSWVEGMNAAGDRRRVPTRSEATAEGGGLVKQVLSGLFGGEPATNRAGWVEGVGPGGETELEINPKTGEVEYFRHKGPRGFVGALQRVLGPKTRSAHRLPNGSWWENEW